jgi:hypothetical protein
MMRSASFLEDVMAVYQGEVFGEALFSALLAAAATPLRRRQFAAMLQMESEAKVRLRPFLTLLGLSIVEDESDRAEGRRAAERLASLPWADFLAAFGTEIEGYVERYREIAERAPAEDREPLRFMVEHELSFLRFVAAERDGRSDDALGAIVSQLQYPLGGEVAPAGVRAVEVAT